MHDRQGQKWNRDEIILALDLYFRIPFSKISQNNKDVIALAELLGRSAGSVGLKLANLASLDPELKKRNIGGMQNASKLDAIIFKEFYDSWDELSFESQKIRSQYTNQPIDLLLPDTDIVQLPPGIDKERETKIRIGQDFFRKAVVSSYESQCCITGINEPQLLIASHIKPWAASDELKERTNPRNGLCLNALHDRAFDKGLLTITKDYRILLSNKLAQSKMDESTKLWLLSYNRKSIILPSRFLPSKEFIEYHNDVIFQR